MKASGKAPAKADTASQSVIELLSKIERVGGRPDAILSGAGAPFNYLDLLAGNVKHVSHGDLTAIYRECVVTIGMHSSQLDSRPRMHPDEFRLMCHCVINCRTFKDVIDRQIQFFGTRGDKLAHLQLDTDDQVAILTMDTMRRRKNFGTFLSDLAGVSFFTRFYSWLIGMSNSYFHVELFYSPNYANDPVNDFFKGEIEFGSENNRISFPKNFLDMPVLRTPLELDKLLTEFPFDFLAENPSGVALHDRIRAVYTTHLVRDNRVPSLSELARMTGRSVSTIRRYLADEGLTIRALKAAARREAAANLLRQKRISIEEVAIGSGFRDINSFRQQFKQWTGMSPSRYRKSHHS